MRPPLSHHPRLWRHAAALTVGLWLFVGIIYLPMLIERHPNDGWSSIALDFSTVFVSMLLAIPLYLVFRATLDWRVWQRAGVISGAVALCAVSQTIFDFQFTHWVASNFQRSWSALPTDPARFYGAMFNYVCVYGVNVALFTLAAARLRGLSQTQDLADARTMAQQAQLAALRFQLNPHFLFNTLNAISAMIVTRRNAEAEEMTEKLCAFLRASLGSDPQALIPLEEELSLAQDYLDIETVRFGERLAVEIELSRDAAEATVPGFLLQPLVENAVKYGVARARSRVTIAITGRVERDQLIVSVCDDAAPVEDAPLARGTQTGLANIRRRLEALYGGQARIDAGPLPRGWCATVRLPVSAREG